MFRVYIHIFSNGKKYVGITSKTLAQRIQNNNGYRNNKKMHNAMKKYKFETICICSNVEKELAEWLEVNLIKALETFKVEFGYNIAMGGSHKFHSEITKLKLSEINKGNKIWLGKKHSLETIKKMKNKTVSQETRVKMSQKRKSRVTLQKTKELMSLAKKGVPKSDEHKEKLRISNKLSHKKESKCVACFSLDDVLINKFESIRDASNYTKIDRASIGRCVNGKQKTAGKLIWRYYNV
jgi:group I intron endonuclease